MTKNTLMPINFLPAIRFIERIEYLSDSLMKRMRVYLKNGYTLSIIQGEFTYGGPEGLFEIAPVDRNGGLNGELLNFEYDDVKGHLTKEEVMEYLMTLGAMEDV